jgi:hypothetical protein
MLNIIAPIETDPLTGHEPSIWPDDELHSTVMSRFVGHIVPGTSEYSSLNSPTYTMLLNLA